MLQKDNIGVLPKEYSKRLTTRYEYSKYNVDETIREDVDIENVSTQEEDSCVSIKIKQTKSENYYQENSNIQLNNFIKNSLVENKVEDTFIYENINFIEDYSNLKESFLNFCYDIDTSVSKGNYNFTFSDSKPESKDDIIQGEETINLGVQAEVVGDNFIANTIYRDYNLDFLSNNKSLLQNVAEQRTLNIIHEENNIELISDLTKAFSKVFYSTTLDNAVENSYSGSNSFKIYPKFIGYLIEKHSVINGSINYHSSFITKKTTIKDKNVRYGNTYIYILRDLFMLSSLNSDDNNIVDYFLVAGNKEISRPNLCKDFYMPFPPEDLYFKHEKNGMLIEWKYPNYGKNHVKGFQILKRMSVLDPFEVIGEINAHRKKDFNEQTEQLSDKVIKRSKLNNIRSFIDEKFDKSKPAIYAIRSISAHGQKSNYSTQAGVYYDYLNNKTLTETVCAYNCPADYPNFYLNENNRFFPTQDSVIDDLTVKGVKKVSVYLTPEYVSIDDKSVYGEDSKYKFTLLNLDRMKKVSHEFTIKNFI